MKKNTLSKVCLTGCIALFVISFSTFKIIAQDKAENPLPDRQEKLSFYDQEASKKPDYAPGEVLVKFKEGVDPQIVLKETGIKAGGIERILPIAPAIAKFKKEAKLEKDADGWFWFLGKRYKETSEIPEEKAFQEAYKNMPEAEKGLYSSYKLALAEGVSVGKAVSELKNNPGVEYAQPNYISEFHTTPNDPYYLSRGTWGKSYDDLWGLKKINAEQAWDTFSKEGLAGYNFAGEEAVVALLDSGVDYNHEDILDNIWVNPAEVQDRNGDGKLDIKDIDTNNDGQISTAEFSAVCNGVDNAFNGKTQNGYKDDIFGWDFSGDTLNIIREDNNVMDYTGHGTHCAGIIAATGNNAKGIIGVAPKAKIMILKIGPNMYEDVEARAIVYAVQNGAKILSNSWGRNSMSEVHRQYFQHAFDSGCVNVVSAGNSGINVKYASPACLDAVVSVAASDPDDRKADFSNWNADIIAPGVDILSLKWQGVTSGQIIGNKYLRLQGTSMACPYVSGAAALIMSKKPGLKNYELYQILRASADDLGQIGRDNDFGYGRLNAHNALKTDVYISSPKNKQFVRGVVRVDGKAFLVDNFLSFELYYVPEGQSESLITYQTHPQNYITPPSSYIPDELLGQWDTALLNDGIYSLVLGVVRRSDNRRIIASIKVAIDNLSQPPVFKNLTNKVAVINRQFNFRIEAEDPDDPSFPLGNPWGRLTYSISNLPVGASFDSNSHTLTWVPTEANKGTYKVTATIRDNEHTVSQDIFLSTLKIIEQPFIVEPGCQVYAHIFEKYVIFREDNKYWLYDLTTQNKAVINIEPSWLYQSTNGEKISWWYGSCIGDVCRSEVWISDFFGNNKEMISGHGVGAKFYKQTIFWLDTTDHKIHKRDLASGVESVVPFSFDIGGITYDVGQNKIIGSIAVSGLTQGTDIFLKDLTSNEERHLLNNKYSQDVVGLVDNNKFVYVDTEILPEKMYLYDLSEDKKIPVATDIVADISYPKIFKDRIVWQDGRISGDGQIYLYDLSTDQEIQISSFLGANHPDIFGDRIVWEDYRNANQNDRTNWDIYMATLSYSPQLDAVVPAEVSLDSAITITGKNFGYSQGASYVRFANGVNGLVESWSNDRIVCRIPTDAQSGELKVVTLGGESNGFQIAVIPVPIITSLQPQVGAIGNSLRIFGRDFGESQARVAFSATVYHQECHRHHWWSSRHCHIVPSTITREAQIVSWSNTEIVCRVPSLPFGNSSLRVLVIDGMQSNSMVFTIS
jgi:thermitase